MTFNVGDKVRTNGPPAGLSVDRYPHLIGLEGVVASTSPDGSGVRIVFIDPKTKEEGSWFWYIGDIQQADADCMPEPDMSLDEIHAAQEIYHGL